MGDREETAQQLMKRLASDPTYQRAMKEKHEEWAARAAQFARDEAPLVEALHAAGERVKSIGDLINTRRAYPHAIQTLVNHLANPYSAAVIEGIARALTVTEARGVAAKPLISLFQRWPGTNLSPKWEIGNAICMTATPDDVEPLLRIALEKSHGPSREGIILAFARLGNPDTDRVILELLTDRAVCVAAAEVSAKRKLVAALPVLRELGEDRDKAIAKAALKAMKKIDRIRYDRP